MRPDIVVRAGGDNGPVITTAKAVNIVASGGTVTVSAVDIDGRNLWGQQVRVCGGSSLTVETPNVGWSSMAKTLPGVALTHAHVQMFAAELAAAAAGTPSPFAEQTFLAIKAARRYHEGNVSIDEAWKYAADDAMEQEKISQRG